MPSLARQLGLALVLLLVWLTAVAGAGVWLFREDRQLQAETVAAKRTQLEALVQLAPTPPAQWVPEYRERLARIVGGTLEVRASPSSSTARTPSGSLSFDVPLGEDGSSGGDRVLHVTLFTPAAARLAALYQRVLVVAALLASLFMIAMLVVLGRHRTTVESAIARPIADARAEMRTLEHLARASVERAEALAREAGARRRAEENLELSRTLLDRSVEDRVQLGRDLHDSLCQTLYAVSLHLEGLRKRLGAASSAEERNLTMCIDELRTANREVRAYIAGLAPVAVKGQGFVEALDATLRPFETLAGVTLNRAIDAQAAAGLNQAQAAEAVQITHEAVSNSIRHGRARLVAVELQRREADVILTVRDDGAGFDPATAARGHGLANMRARAQSIGGALQILSARGAGTRLELRLSAAA